MHSFLEETKAILLFNIQCFNQQTKYLALNPVKKKFFSDLTYFLLDNIRPDRCMYLER